MPDDKSLAEELAELLVKRGAEPTEERINRVIGIKAESEALAEEMIAILQGHNPAVMGTALSYTCVSFFNAVEKNMPGNGNKAKATMVKSFDILESKEKEPNVH